MYTYLDPPFSVPRVNPLRISTSSVGGCWYIHRKIWKNHVYNGFPCRRGDEISTILSPFHIGCWPDVVLTSHNSCQFYCWWPKVGQPLEYGEYLLFDHCFIHHQYYCWNCGGNTRRLPDIAQLKHSNPLNALPFHMLIPSVTWWLNDPRLLDWLDSSTFRGSRFKAFFRNHGSDMMRWVFFWEGFLPSRKLT